MMADNFDPFKILAGKKKLLSEAWADFRKRRDGETESEKAGLTEAKQRYDLALQEFKQASLDYFPLSAEDRISSPPVARAAYSDRMAWLMANMANMAYIRYEYGFEPDEAQRLARQEAGIAQLEFCLQSGQYSQKEDEYEKHSDTSLCFELVKIFDSSQTGSTDTQAFLAKSEAIAVLAFRGTEPDHLADILTDLKAVLHSTRDGDVHLGFQEAYAEVREEIHAALPAIGSLPLYITGHSLGAALATVATQDLDQEKTIRDRVAACYTFGSPRVGDGKYESKIKVPFYRLAHGTDIVTLVPAFFWKYVHVGDPRYLSPAEKGRLLYRGIPVGRRTWDAIVQMLSALSKGQNPLSVWVTAHSMVHYIDKLKKVAIARNTF